MFQKEQTVNQCTQRHTHTPINMHVHMHTHMHACAHACTHTHASTHKTTNTGTHKCVCANACMYHTFTCMHSCIHAHACKQTCMYTHPYTHVHTHTYTRAHTHTHTHTWHQVGAGNTAHPNCLAAQVPSVQVSWQTAPSPCCILPFSAHHPDVGIPMVPHARRVQREPTDEGRSCSQTDPPSGPTLSTAVLANLSEMNITL